MGWVIKYRGEFTDIQGVFWKIEIEEDNYVGNILELQFTESPILIEFLANGDLLFDNPVKGSKADFAVWSDEDFQYAGLYSIGDFQYRVRIYRDESVLYWSGYIMACNYSEAYEGVSYPVTISASCGLGQLKNIDYKNGDEYYNGRIRESQIIFDILGKIGYTSFFEFCNIYEDRMVDNVEDSFFDKTFPDVDLFKDNKCYNVLVKLLEKHNAIIRQSYGAFYIIRPAEMIGDSVAGRFFTGATTKNSVTIVPDQFIHRTATHPLRTIRQVPGGMKMIQPQVKEVITKQDYGNKESWLDNYQFKSKTYSDNKFDHWENGGAVGISSIAYLIPGETEGVVIYSKDTSPNHSRHIYQVFGTDAIMTGDEFGFEFDFLLYNSGSELVEDVMFFVEVKDLAGNFWMKNTIALTPGGIKALDDCAWYPGSQQFIVFQADSPPGITDWMQVKRKVPGLPVNGPYKISIYSLYSTFTNIMIAVRGVKFYTYSLASSLKSEKMLVPYQKKKFPGLFYRQMREKEIYVFPAEPMTVSINEFSVKNDIEGEIIEYNPILGDVVGTDIDNVLEQFAGALGMMSGSEMLPTVSWSRRGESDMKQLLQIMAEERAAMYSRPKELIQMPIMDMAGPMAINLLGNIQDSKNTLDGMARVFVINRGEFDVRNRMWNLDLFEIGTKTIVPEEPGEPGGTITADSTSVTSDSTIITADHG